MGNREFRRVKREDFKALIGIVEEEIKKIANSTKDNGMTSLDDNEIQSIVELLKEEFLMAVKREGVVKDYSLGDWFNSALHHLNEEFNKTEKINVRDAFGNLTTDKFLEKLVQRQNETPEHYLPTERILPNGVSLALGENLIMLRGETVDFSKDYGTAKKIKDMRRNSIPFDRVKEEFTQEEIDAAFDIIERDDKLREADIASYDR